jgi:hypothetical protein
MNPMRGYRLAQFDPIMATAEKLAMPRPSANSRQRSQPLAKSARKG